MKIGFALTIGLVSALALPIGAQAQGLIGGAEQGAHEGDRAAGPLGAVVGGAVGAGVGTVDGALGIRPHHRCWYHHGVRHCRY
jgi:hypothetical protein